MIDVEILPNTIYRHVKYMHLTGKWGAEVLDMYYSLSHRSLTFFHLCFEHRMAVSRQECHCNSSPHYLAL